MARRGFFAELQHQTQVAARERERAQRIAVQQHNAAVRRTEQAQRAATLAAKQLASATEAERKRLAKEAHEAQVAAMEAEAEERNHKLAQVYGEVDSLLAATLEVDDFVDLKTLHVVAEHPPFSRPELEEPIPVPDDIPDLPQPIYVAPEQPRGLAGLFGKAKYAEAVANAQQAHADAVSEWQAQCEQLQARRQVALARHARAEADRVAALAAALAAYKEESATREAQAAERNRRLDELIANLSYGTADAVQEYVSIVLSNSVYPEHFAVTHEFHFEPSSAELTLRALVPNPDSIPEIKTYKYSKSTDEITATSLSPKACRDRYAGAVHQVALRSIHEVFEADRRGIIKTIRLEVGTQAIHPATGCLTYVPFVVVAAERGTFLEFNLAAVIPELTLERLGAAVSKNPYGLVAAEAAGVRRT